MKKICVVDDSPSERQRMREILERNGYEVHEAIDGESGIALVQEVGPAAVLMDVVMPGLNGFQATRKLSRMPETELIPIVMVTTKDQETDRIWGERQGAVAYLNKPVNEAVLLDVLSKVIV